MAVAAPSATVARSRVRRELVEGVAGSGVELFRVSPTPHPRPSPPRGEGSSFSSARLPGGDGRFFQRPRGEAPSLCFHKPVFDR